MRYRREGDGEISRFFNLCSYSFRVFHSSHQVQVLSNFMTYMYTFMICEMNTSSKTKSILLETSFVNLEILFM